MTVTSLVVQTADCTTPCNWWACLVIRVTSYGDPGQDKPWPGLQHSNGLTVNVFAVLGWRIYYTLLVGNGTGVSMCRNHGKDDSYLRT